MNEKEKETLFAQICNSIGFAVNTSQSAIILKVVDLINLKGKGITFEDVDNIIKPYVKLPEKVEEKT
jgi:hypothetical protein